MRNTWTFLLFLVSGQVLELSAQSDSTGDGLYKVIYEADKDGNPIRGSLNELLEYVQEGNPVRVGWKLVTVWTDTTIVMTHWTDGGFITALRGHVFAQIRGIFGQGTAHISAPPGVFLSSKVPNSWVGVIGTDGVLRSKFHIDEWMKELPEDAIKNMEKTKVATMWAVMMQRN